MIRASWIQWSAMAALAAGTALAQNSEDLRLTVGKSVVIDYPSDVRQISTSNPEIMDASPVTTREILLNGKALGTSTMVVWDKAGQRTFYNVNVELNLDPLRRLLKDTYPKEDIQPRSSRDTITLSGHVTKKEIGEQAMTMAATYGKTVVNNMQVSAPAVEKQILLRVRFAELDRTKETQFSVNLLGLAGQTQLSTTAGQLSASGTSGLSATGGGVVSNSTSSVSIPTALSIFGFNPKLNIGAFLNALQSENILEILAEPNLVTTNGKEASFLSGGQFPVPVLQGGANAGAVTVQFKEFGIILRFLPTVTDHGTIKMHLYQEVSTIDTANAVTLDGFSIPGLATRKAETDVELAQGQSFVVAGLLDNQEQDAFAKIPILSSLPIFGSLFKQKTETKSRTDLLLVVTPEITEPLNPSEVPNLYMPKDFLVRLDANNVQQQTKGKSH